MRASMMYFLLIIKMNQINDLVEILPINTINEIPEIVLGWYKKGLPDREVRKKVELARPKYKEFDIDQVIEIALSKFKKEFSKERDHILALHLSRYDEAITKLYNFKSRFQGKRAIFDITENYYQLLAVMKQKETLFGFHKKSFQIKVSNVINKRKRAILSDKFNISLLSSEEQLDFLGLLTKTKSNPEDAIKTITLNKPIVYSEYKEVQLELLPQLESIKLIETQTERSLSIEEVSRKLQQTQLQLIADTYKKK